MEREQKVVVVEERRNKKKQEQVLGQKLRGGVLVGKRGGNSTPSTIWRVGLAQSDGSLVQDFTFPSKTASLSVRKLGANLWEVQPQLNMSKICPHSDKDKHSELPSQLAEPPDSPQKQATSTSSLGKEIAASLRQNHHLLGKIGGSQLFESPASYSSSMKMAPYKPVVTPTSTKDLKGGRIGKSNYSLKTSTELLKILNRIWILEERHASNMSLVKELKRDFNHSQRCVKELQEEKKRDREEINDMMTLIAEHKICRKSNKDDKIKDAVKTLTEDLQDERKLRKHSENLHRNLAQELAEVKASFSNAFKELERERKARIMLEELCDEFAKGIKKYEQELRFLSSKREKDHSLIEENDGLIIHITEAWLDERMQMKQAKSFHDLAEKKSTVDKLRFEIQTFLQAKQSGDYRKNFLNTKGAKGNSLRRASLESVHLNNAASELRNDRDRDSFDNATRVYESSRGISVKHDNNSCINQHEECVSNIHVDEKTESSKGNKMQFGNKEEAKLLSETPVKGNDSCVLENSDMKQKKSQRRKNNRIRTRYSLLNNLIRDHSSPLEGTRPRLQNDDTYMEHSIDPTNFTGRASPTQKWTSKLTATNPEVVESSSKLPLGVKENTLKAKLLEARLERQQFKSRAL